jgi:hypothetical protein
MRTNDLKVQAIAREVGMLFMKDGREVATCLRVDGLEMSFDYENPEEDAHVTICQDHKPWRTQDVYMGSQLDINLIKTDYPQFFK